MTRRKRGDGRSTLFFLSSWLRSRGNEEPQRMEVARKQSEREVTFCFGRGKKKREVQKRRRRTRERKRRAKKNESDQKKKWKGADILLWQRKEETRGKTDGRRGRQWSDKNKGKKQRAKEGMWQRKRSAESLLLQFYKDRKQTSQDNLKWAREWDNECTAVFIFLVKEPKWGKMSRKGWKGDQKSQ